MTKLFNQVPHNEALTRDLNPGIFDSLHRREGIAYFTVSSHTWFEIPERPEENGDWSVKK